MWGRNPVRALLRGDRRRADEIAVLAGAHGPLAELVSLARQAGVKVSYRTREQLTAIAGTPEHQGVVARVAAAEYVDLEDLLAIPGQRGEAAVLPRPRPGPGSQEPRSAAPDRRRVRRPRRDRAQAPRGRAHRRRGPDRHGGGGVRVGGAGNQHGPALEKLKESGVWIYGAVPTAGTRAVGRGPARSPLSGPRERGGGATSAGRPDLRRSAVDPHGRAGRVAERGRRQGRRFATKSPARGVRPEKSLTSWRCAT